MLAPWKKSYAKPRQHIKKQRHSFADKDSYSQSYMGFSSSHIGMWELDHKGGWALKNWCFLNCGVGEDSWVPWTARRSNQSILKEISPDYSLEGLMLRLKRQYFAPSAPPMRRADSEKMLGKIEGRRGRGQEVGWHHQHNGHEFEQTLGDWEGQGSLGCCIPWGHRIRDDWVTEQQMFDLKFN